MKKRLTMELLFAVAVVMAGCAGKDETTTEAQTTVQEEIVETKQEEANDVTEDETSVTEQIEDNQVAELTVNREPVEIKDIENIVEEEEGVFTCSYEGVKHDFIICLPEQVQGAPLVLMLHGYAESAEGMKNNFHFEEAANPEGYAVVYVTGAPNPGDTTSANGWNSGIAADGNNDVGFLASLAVYLQKEYSFDSERTYAVGFSNGAFMTHRLAMEAGKFFPAVVSVAGMMPESIWNERNEKNNVGILQITGEKDDVVPKNSDGSAKHNKAPAIEEVIGYWADSNGLSTAETGDIGKKSTITKYSAEGCDKQVWDVFVKDGRHSWPQESITGIDTNALILEYLNTMK